MPEQPLKVTIVSPPDLRPIIEEAKSRERAAALCDGLAERERVIFGLIRQLAESLVPVPAEEPQKQAKHRRIRLLKNVWSEVAYLPQQYDAKMLSDSTVLVWLSGRWLSLKPNEFEWVE